MTDCDFPELVPRDRLDAHHRQQLSAMLDGELPPDQAKFMLRRLQHDVQLAACWERWQVCGDVLRGRHEVLLPADFSQRVMAAIGRGDAAAARVSTPLDEVSTRHSSRWLRWGGGALAASVALVALIVARPMASPSADDANPVAAAASQPAILGTDAAVAGVTATEADASASMDIAAQRPITADPATPHKTAQAAAGGVAAMALAQQGSRRAGERTARGQSQRAGLRLRARAADPQPQVALASASAPASRGSTTTATAGLAAAPGLAPLAARDPFAAQAIAPSRPWPRAVLPGYAAGGAFTASYGSDAPVAFHPFEPQVVPAADSHAAAPEPEAPPQSDAAARGPH